MCSALADLYDRLPYPPLSFGATHPDRLAAVAKLHGLDPAPPDNARVLGIGCAGGGNLVPMAAGLPGSHFTGVDLSPRQLADARAFAEATGTDNVTFVGGDIRDYVPEEPLDYIVAHGVFSWVDDEVRAAILRLCAEHLSERGLAYLSYNALPGWHSRGALRWMLRFHTAAIDDPTEKVAQARALIDFLANHQAEGTDWDRWLTAEREALRTRHDAFVFHDLLEPDNQPFHLATFASLAADHGLSYVGEADFSHLMPDTVSPELLAAFGHMAKGRFEQQELDDSLRDRTFHSSLLSRGRPSVDPVPSKLAAMYVCGSATGIERAGDTLEVREILAAAHAALPADLAIADSPHPEAGAAMMALLADRSLDLLTRERGLPTALPERPQLTATVRWQLDHGGPHVTTRRHELYDLDGLDRVVLPLLDGTHTVDAVIDAVVAQAEAGSFRVEVPKEQLRPAIAEAVSERLGRTLKAGLLR